MGMGAPRGFLCDGDGLRGKDALRVRNPSRRGVLAVASEIDARGVGNENLIENLFFLTPQRLVFSF